MRRYEAWDKLNQMFRTFFVAMVISLWGYLSTTEYNPFVDIDVYEVVVVEDFERPGKAVYEFAARVIRVLSTSGLFSSVVRAESVGPALRELGETYRRRSREPICANAVRPQSWKRVLCGRRPIENGYMNINDAPVFGIDINEELAAKYPLSEEPWYRRTATRPGGTFVRL